MAAVEEREVVRKIAQQQTVALLNLRPEQDRYLHELRDLFHKSQDPQEKLEIRDAFYEIIFPEGVILEGNLDAWVSDATKDRVVDYHRQVGQEIKRRRTLKNMTQTELARLAGIPQSHVSRLEAGKHTPTHITIAKIAKALKTKPKMLDPGFSS